jgi:hypothetical protein
MARHAGVIGADIAFRRQAASAQNDRQRRCDKQMLHLLCPDMPLAAIAAAARLMIMAQSPSEFAVAGQSLPAPQP